MNDIAIHITGLKKRYRLGQIGGGTLQADLQSWWARIRGKEDPNSQIGTDERSRGKTFMALNGIDLTVRKGEALGIIGHNGAGKSTLLKLLSRVTAPTEGEIALNGRITSMLEVGTGFNGEMTGRENVYMNGAILGMTREEVDRKMEQIIEFSEVREFIDTPVKRYSSGMYVKLAFSVAAHLVSEIMIMDEVLAVGDMAFQKKCLEKMRDAAKQEGRTVLYVSHNMNTIRQLCDRCIFLDKGKVTFDGDVQQAINLYMADYTRKQRIARFYEFTKEQRCHLYSTDRFIIRSLSMKDNPDVFHCGDRIAMTITVFSKEQQEDVYFRFEIHYQDMSIAGISMTSVPVSFAAGEEKRIPLHLPTDLIVEGRYSVSIVAFQRNDVGGEFFLDGVFPSCTFELLPEKDRNSDFIWQHQFWGHIRLKETELIGQAR